MSHSLRLRLMVTLAGTTRTDGGHFGGQGQDPNDVPDDPIEAKFHRIGAGISFSDDDNESAKPNNPYDGVVDFWH